MHGLPSNLREKQRRKKFITRPAGDSLNARAECAARDQGRE